MTLTYTPEPSIAYRVIEDHVFIITPDSRQHELDGPVELLVWRLCEQEARTRCELVDAIVANFDVKTDQATMDLEVFLDEMTAAGVLTTQR